MPLSKDGKDPREAERVSGGIVSYNVTINHSVVGGFAVGTGARASLDGDGSHASRSGFPFEVVDRVMLKAEAAKPTKAFVARTPEWQDVIHGADATIGFVERTQTEALLHRVEDELKECLNRERLAAIFVVGPPGAGKTTLVRRVAAMVVQRETAVVATSVRSTSPRLDAAERDDWLRGLEALAVTRGLPVLLVLNDPFFRGSGWIPLLNKLAGRSRNIVVLGASPLLSFSEHKGDFAEIVACAEVALGPPTRSERRSLATLYRHDPACFDGRDSDPFLVLAMEAAGGVPFGEHIERIWRTLNGDGKLPAARRPPRELPWPVRAFLLVCYFHRSGVSCPEELLRSALATDAPTAELLRHRVAQMKDEHGWGIFSLHHGFRNTVLFGSSHQLVAEAAWQARPTTPSFDPAEWLIPAALDVPDPGAGRVATALGTLAVARAAEPGPPGEDLAGTLAQSWTEALRSGRVGMLSYYALFAALNAARPRGLAAGLEGGLRHALAANGPHSWLALLALHHLSADITGIHRPRVLEHADLHISPVRAMDLVKRLLKHEPDAIAALLRRLTTLLEHRGAQAILRYLVEDKVTADRALTIARPWLAVHGLVESAWQVHVAVVRARAGEADFVEGALAWLERHPSHEHNLDVLERLLSHEAGGARLLRNVAAWLDRNQSQRGTANLLRACLRTGQADAAIASLARAWLNKDPDYATIWEFVAPVFAGPVPESPLEEVVSGWATSQLGEEHFGAFLRLRLSGKRPGARAFDIAVRWLGYHQREAYAAAILPTLLKARKLECLGSALEWLSLYPRHPMTTHVLKTLIAGGDSPDAALDLARRWLRENEESPEWYDLWNTALTASAGAADLRNLGDTYARKPTSSHADLAIDVLLRRLDGSMLEDIDRLLAAAEAWLTSNRGHSRWHALLITMLYRGKAPRLATYLAEARTWLDENRGHPNWHEVLANALRHSGRDSDAPDLIALGEAYVQQRSGFQRLLVICGLLLAGGARPEHVALALDAWDEPNVQRHVREKVILRDLSTALAYHLDVALSLLNGKLPSHQRIVVMRALVAGVAFPHRSFALTSLLDDHLATLAAHDAHEVLRRLVDVESAADRLAPWVARRLSCVRGSREYGALVRIIRHAVERSPVWRSLVRTPPFEPRAASDILVTSDRR